MCYNLVMRLSRKIDQALLWIATFAIVVVFAAIATHTSRNTFADNDNAQNTYQVEGAKFVTFYDDGAKTIIKTNALTVGEAISRANIILNDGDKVEPTLNTEINMDNFFINIYRARPVIVKDGTTEKYLMTASYDYKTIMSDAGITIYDGDEINYLPNTNFLESGVANVYEIKRNGGRTITVEEEIPFTEETVADVTLATGTSEVRQLGEVGAKKVYYNVLYIDNQEASREKVSEEIIREPVPRIVAVGAKKSIRPEAETCAAWARAAGVSEADLTTAIVLIYHESGCRVDAANSRSGAYGIPQALPGSKMASAGADWATNPVTQIRWMIGYVNGRYGGWSQALAWWYSHGWY